MKKLLLAVAATLVFSVSAFAGTVTAHDFKSIAAKIFQSPKASSFLKSQKNDLAIVYGGEDITRKIADNANSFTA